MLDRPTFLEIIDAVCTHLEKRVIPAVHDDRKLYYQTLVALNVLHIVEREMHAGEEPFRQEWARLNFVQGVAMPFPEDIDVARAALAERNRKLCDEIDSGRYDFEPRRAGLYEHLLMTARAQLEIANPRFLEALAKEDAARSS